MKTKILAGIVIFASIIIGVMVGINDGIYIEKPVVDVDSDNLVLNISGDEDLNSGDISGDNLSSGDTSGDIALTNPTTTDTKYLPENIRAIYTTGWVMGTPSIKNSVITQIKENGYNAIVIDIKDEAGQLSYNSEVQTAIDIKSSRGMVSNIKAVIEELKANDIYVIGRIVTFKDPIYASKVNDIAYKKSDGTLWKDYSGNAWPNPYNEASWEYPIALAKEAAALGFQEIQFDYVRFPSSEGRTSAITYGFESDEKTKSQIINGFLIKVMEELEESNVIVSADVFGITTKRDGDFENIGQNFAEIAAIVDVICPMVYPSHYNFNEYKIAKPDKNPYSIVYNSVKDGFKRMETYTSGDTTIKMANVRPYLQDFTASWLGSGNYLSYGTTEVTAQIQALYDLGVKDFCLWDPSNKYCYSALANVKEPDINSVSGDDVNSTSSNLNV